jgi:hypothetical protein
MIVASIPMWSPHPVHARGSPPRGRSDVPPADHERRLDAHAMDLGDLAGDRLHDRPVDSESLRAHEGLAR